jgi:hypothetical protein
VVPRVPIPAAPLTAHLFAAGLLWSLVGLGLTVTGAHWILTAGHGWAIPALALAVAAGLAKARWVLRKTARRTGERIERRGDGRCIGGFLSWKSWLLVAAMMALGRLLRASPLPPLARGAIYAGIGVALAVASLSLWGRWRRVRSAPGAQAGLRRPSV